VTKWMEIDYDCLRTGTAIGFHAFRELCSNFLLCIFCHFVGTLSVSIIVCVWSFFNIWFFILLIWFFLHYLCL